MTIQGSIEQLGGDKHRLKMVKAPFRGNQDWLQSKFGTKVQPWEYSIKISSHDKLIEKLPFDIKYRYTIENTNGRRIAERMGVRKLEIQKPETYKGQITKAG